MARQSEVERIKLIIDANCSEVVAKNLKAFIDEEQEKVNRMRQVITRLRRESDEG